MRRRRHLLWIALLALTVAAPPALAKRAGKKKTKKKHLALPLHGAIGHTNGKRKSARE